MRKIYIWLASAAMLVITGCSDFLDQDNKGNIGQGDYYSTDKGFESLSNASYSILRTLYGGDPWLTEAGGDLFTSGRSPVANIGRYTITQDDGSVKSFYTDHYKAISLTNDVIFWGGDVASRARLVSEARGMRAMHYLALVQQFGGVPLVVERQSEVVPEMGRSSAEAIYNFIIEELTELSGSSSALLAKASGDNFNHFDQRAAAHFLAKAYLCRGYESFGTQTDFEKAREAADKAIGGSKLTTSFGALWNVDGENDNEVIFSVEYNRNTTNKKTDGSRQQANFGPYLDGQEKGHKYTTSTLSPTLWMHQVFAEDTSNPAADERYEATFMTELRNSYWDYYDGSKKNSSAVSYYYCPEWLLNDTTAWRNELASRENPLLFP